MVVGAGNKLRLLPSRVAPDFLAKPGSGVLEDLISLADDEQTISELSRKLFQGLRKQIGSPDLLAHLLGIQYLAFQGEVAGTRLLAAYLDVTTAGARLIPLVRDFSNTRRQHLFLKDQGGNLKNTRDWQNSVQRLSGLCNDFPLEKKPETTVEEPWGRMRPVLAKLLGDVITGDGVSAAHRPLLADLLRLETDAWEERVGRLAAMVNPFRVSSVQKVLPILGRADMSIRDLRQLISWVEEGQDHQAFTRQGFRALEVLDEDEFNAIFTAMKSEMKLQVLAGLHRGGRDNPLALESLALGTARLMALDHRLITDGIKTETLDLLSAVALVQQYSRGRGFALPLDQEQEILLNEILVPKDLDVVDDCGPASWSLEGARVDVGQLVIGFESKSGEMKAWPHGLPTVSDVDPYKKVVTPEAQDGVGDNQEDLDASAIKHLVMSNIMSISVLLGFLRNPKVVAIPGLVAAVATRTRNPQIIETIAQDRALYSGFANRDVPLACLRSPVNVPPKTLRKFIHVKFISKIDLKRMANDRTGTRKEIVREINQYLNNLS